ELSRAERDLYEQVSDYVRDEMGKDKMSTVMDKFQHTGAWNLPVVKDGKYEGFVSKSKLLSIYRRKLIYFTQ
ncbi:MAG: chloride channel protein, partial [Capnocytophaga ochracea]